MKTIRGEPGDTMIPASYDWVDRIVPIVWIGGCFAVGAHFFLRTKVIRSVLETGYVAPMLWLMFCFWLLLLALACARTLWMFYGVIKISVTADEIVVRLCIDEETIHTSDPIKLSTIIDVYIKDEVVNYKGNTWIRWPLIVHLADGGTRRVATFKNVFDANAFMDRYVQ